MRQEVRQLAGVELDLALRAGRHQLAAARFELASELGEKSERPGAEDFRGGRRQSAADFDTFRE
jgi:hypothetical protein